METARAKSEPPPAKNQLVSPFSPWVLCLCIRPFLPLGCGVGILLLFPVFPRLVLLLFLWLPCSPFFPWSLQTSLSSRVLCANHSSFWKLLRLVPSVESAAPPSTLCLETPSLSPDSRRGYCLSFRPCSVPAMIVVFVCLFLTHRLSPPSSLPTAGVCSRSFCFSDTLM